MRFDKIRVPYANPLVNQYLNDFAAVAGHFEYNFNDPAAFHGRREKVLARYKTNRKDLAGVLRDFNAGLNCGPETLANLDLLEQEDAVVVLTGQQPGIFTGPLYTVYKAITAVKLAQKLRDEQGMKVVPLFWIGGEDHDFYEVAHTFVLTAKGVEKLVLPVISPKKQSVGNLPVTPELIALIEQFAGLTPPGTFKDEAVAWLKEASESGVTLGLWFARLMAGLFRDYGLVLVNALDPALKGLGVPKMQEFVSRTEDIQRAFAAGEARVREGGFEPQVPLREEGQAHLFMNFDGERRTLFFRNGRFSFREKGRDWTVEEISHGMTKNPLLLSPNVATKPVLQDYLFPILAYIGGPGEIGYYAQFKEMYRAFGGEMPVIYPRLNITVIEENMARHLDKYQLDFRDVAEGLQEKLNTYLAKSDPLEIVSLLESYKEKFSGEYREIVGKAALLDPHLEKLGNENLDKIRQQIDFFDKKVQQQLRKNSEVAVGQFERLGLNLRPLGNWQERIYNIFQYYFKYGPAFIEGLMKMALSEDSGHNLWYMGADRG